MLEAKPVSNNTGNQKMKDLMLENNNLTRKFTRADEVNLVKAVMTHGKKWKTIWQATPELQHIYHSALKDRARSKRFKDIFAKAEADPSLLDNPDELCGTESQQEVTEDVKTEAVR